MHQLCLWNSVDMSHIHGECKTQGDCLNCDSRLSCSNILQPLSGHKTLLTTCSDVPVTSFRGEQSKTKLHHGSRKWHSINSINYFSKLIKRQKYRTKEKGQSVSDANKLLYFTLTAVLLFEAILIHLTWTFVEEIIEACVEAVNEK